MRTPSILRKLNAVLSVLIVGLLLFHAVGNSFQLLGVGTPVAKQLGRALLLLVSVHALIGLVLTIDSVRVQREVSAGYPELNKRFWAIRISGVLIVGLVLFHVWLFLNNSSPYRLREFDELQLVLSICFVLAIGVHVIANMLPLMLSLGIEDPHERAGDFVFVVAVLLLLFVVAFVVYYLRWSMV